MRKQYIEVPLSLHCRGLCSKATRLKGLLLAPWYWLMALRAGGPGLAFHARCSRLGFLSFLTRRLHKGNFHLMCFPMDSTRYFEFHETWRRLRGLRFSRYLDVSSPRLLPLMLARENPAATVDLLNPDPKDIQETEKLFNAFLPKARWKAHNATIAAAELAPASFDLVTCLSVLEHIPADSDAVRQMWSLLKPGGRLALTLPCMQAALEQYISHDLYGVLEPGSDGYTFWQRYYDEAMINDNIIAIIGNPEHKSIYGEKRKGYFFRNATAKRLLGALYPFWKEPYMMATEYRYFDAIEELPGEGVVYLEFVKP